MSSEPRDDDYLWDPRAPVDPEVERLERLLRPLAHDPAQPVVRALAPARGAALRLWGWIGAVAATVLAVVWVAGRASESTPPPPASGLELVALDPQQHLAESAWLETGAEVRELRLGNVGQVTLGAGSRLEVRRLSAQETRLYLERGRLEALVSADAEPRFFQVDTPATRCVDLGCRYTLVVDERGDALVEVETGRVAFENDGRAVLVPRGARCRATRSAGAGTPRFLDAAAPLVEALDGFDAAVGAPAERRRALAVEALRAAASLRDALAVWHLLQDPDVEIAALAHLRLAELTEAPPAARSTLGSAPDATARAAWRETLEPSWW